MLRNLVTSVLDKERVKTTLPKAKEARRFTERMITLAKRGDLTARRNAARFIIDPKVLQKLFDVIGPRYAERPGGFTRVLRAGIRTGDDAEMAILELVGAELKSKPKTKRAKAKLEAAGGQTGSTAAKAVKAMEAGERAKRKTPAALPPGTKK
jgi:large subunit ribosomal protein L17